MAGSFIVVLILFIVPITLLGEPSHPMPSASLSMTLRKAGQISGQIYAVSTLGSFIGTFLPTLIFIPTIGTTKTSFVFGLFLLFVALIGQAKFASRKRNAQTDLDADRA
jgi:predicted membrane-bound spermidine synthase